MMQSVVVIPYGRFGPKFEGQESKKDKFKKKKLKNGADRGSRNVIKELPILAA
jgi:hypothetical protein